MLKKISSYLSVKETEMLFYIYANFFKKIGKILNPKIGNYFSFLGEYLSDKIVLEESKKIATMGLLKKRISYLFYRFSKFFSPEVNKHFGFLNINEFENYQNLIKSRSDEIMYKFANLRNDEIKKTREMVKELYINLAKT